MIEQERYQGIRIAVCSLLVWSHMFLKIELAGEGACLYYDPWYQRCSSEVDASVPFFYDEQDAAKTIRNLVSTMSYKGLMRITYLQPYDLSSQKLSDPFVLNHRDEFDYEEIHWQAKPEAPASCCSIS